MLKKDSKHLRLLVLAAALLGLMVSTGRALIIEFSLPELVQQSELILRGQVTKTECRWGTLAYDQNRQMIFTDVTIAPTEFLKGASDLPALIVATEGGELNGLGVVAEDQPQFAAGQEVIVFLGPSNDQGQREVTNYYNGKYTIVEDAIIENGEPATQFAGEITQTVRNQEGR